MLIINNADVARVLTMADTIEVLERAYTDLLTTRDAVCRPRIDIQIPTDEPGVIYQWGTMEGGSTRGYFAIPHGHRAHGVAMPDRVVWFADLLNRTKPGRASREQITYTERGNLQ